RCRDCFQPAELCSTCQIDAHASNPFHWIDTWTGAFFGHDSLSKLGLIINLGHDGAVCSASAHLLPVSFVVAHLNGLHTVSICFCTCSDGPARYIQLLRAQLFPVTFDSPKTAFTFAILKDFHLHTLCSKKSAYNYFAKLVRQTSDVMPSSTSDRYRELLRTSRIWMDLEASRRSGQAHGMQQQLPSFAATGIRSPLCPACPQLGINLTSEDLEEADPEKPHLLALYLGGDGNFSLSSKKKPINAKDMPLNNGNGFFPEQKQFEEYILAHEDLPLVSHGLLQNVPYLADLHDSLRRAAASRRRCCFKEV
ncbi:hypothetical protein CALVIDRAFT_481338, partial [Calocera viscosa TUFC12733]